MHSRWQEGNNKREALEAKRHDGRQSVMPRDDDVYTSGDDKAKSLSRVQLFVTPWTVACQSPLSLGFSRQEDWNGLPCPPPEDLPNTGTEPRSPTLRADPLLSELPGKTCAKINCV